MNEKPRVTRTALLLTILALASTPTATLYAQGYTVTIRARPATGAYAVKYAETTKRLQYSIPLSFDSRQIESILRDRPTQISVSFPTELPFPQTMVMGGFEVFTPEAKSYRGTANGDEETPFRNQWLSFLGRFPDDEKSVVVMNFSASGADAMFLLRGDAYYIRPVGEAQNQSVRPHIFYAAAAVNDQIPFRCGTVDPGVSPEVNAVMQQLKSRELDSKQTEERVGTVLPPRHDPPRVANPFGSAVSSDTIDVRVALEGDYELFLATGSEEAAQTLMMSSATYASAIYLAQTSIKLTVPFIRAWTTASNPYGHIDLFTSLDDFVRHWSQNMNNVDRTVAHLFTNSARWTNISGYVGVAKLNSLCSNLTGYGVTEVRQPTGEGHLMTFTHELGHNFGAHHTHSCFWPNGPLDYCATIEEGSCYTGQPVQSDGTIMSYCSTRRFEFGPVVAGLIRRNAEFSSCAPSLGRSAVAQSDSSFLDNLYSSNNGSAWTRRTNWQTGPVTGRTGITVRGGRVISINLPANNINGQIPTSISTLTALRVLNLSGRNKYHVPSVAPPDPETDVFNRNNLSGSIPTAITQLTSLEELDLSNNQLTGSFPAGLTALPELRVLNLSENNITGSIPSSIGNLTNLETLDLWRTWMSGSIPSSIGNLRSLRVLVLSSLYGSAADQYARLYGTIPPEIGNLSRLSVLDLSLNALTGQIPPQMGNLTSLTTLDLGGNELSGPIPSEFSNLRGLTSLGLNDNHLTGTLPAYLGTFSSLSSITIANNRLSGPLPVELGKLSGLLGLYLAGNAFTGPIPPSFGAMTSLLDFDLHGNALTGSIPDSLRFLGTSAPGDFGGLLILRVGDNKLTGSVPGWLNNRPSISQIDLGGNQLDNQNGPIPDWVFNRASLVLLHLHGMQYTGTFPTQALQFANLTSLKLSGNQLTGTIPTQIGTALSLNVLWLSDNKFSGSLPVELGNLLSLGDLRLSNNQFTGTIPSSLGKIAGQLQYLYLSGNKFTGSVPAGFETFGSLTQLALNDNDLEDIPRLFVLSRALRDTSGFMALQNNRLTFTDLAPMTSAHAQIPFLNFTYAPQKPFGTAQVVTIAVGASDTLKVTVDSLADTYQWQKNGAAIPGATKSSYTISSMTGLDAGQYVVIVKNASIPLLTLQSQPFTVRLAATSRPDIVALSAPAHGASGVPRNATITWNASLQAESYRIQVSTDSGFAATAADTTLSTTSLTLKSLAANTRHFWRVRGENGLGSGDYSSTWSFTTSSAVTGVTEDHAVLPREFRLEQNYPNPFNPATTIEFSVPQKTHVRLLVYTLLGQLAETLYDGEANPGKYNVRWDATRYASGFYLCRFEAGGFVETKKLFLLK